MVHKHFSVSILAPQDNQLGHTHKNLKTVSALETSSFKLSGSLHVYMCNYGQLTFQY